ncbi:hypothetical protein SCHPADRAFT_821578 [Schizopora paradoxa]|uniref:RING-type domain-containing protein n=1 Tax=Schizopora paradoxa TaxID=27342 RepID=A0A0H2S053_9AGAM|nr:hypothetical protein SCHPADRAFT_821578 [Schizopora paradoxa]
MNSSPTAGPALGEPSSSKRRIPVASSSKPSISKLEAELVSSRSPSPSPNFPSSSKHPAGPEPEPLSTYVCPICLSPPTNATLTPCGHICCGECLFTAVRSALQRAATQATREPVQPRCPVCRAVLKNWDGKGRGVIGLKPRVMIAL